MKKDNKLFTEGELEIFLRVLASVPMKQVIQFGNIQITRTSEENFIIKVTDDILDYTLSLSSEQERQNELKQFLGGNL